MRHRFLYIKTPPGDTDAGGSKTILKKEWVENVFLRV